jgi:hypothetical protein
MSLFDRSGGRGGRPPLYPYPKVLTLDLFFAYQTRLVLDPASRPDITGKGAVSARKTNFAPLP